MQTELKATSWVKAATTWSEETQIVAIELGKIISKLQLTVRELNKRSLLEK